MFVAFEIMWLHSHINQIRVFLYLNILPPGRLQKTLFLVTTIIRGIIALTKVFLFVCLFCFVFCFFFFIFVNQDGLFLKMSKSYKG